VTLFVSQVADKEGKYCLAETHGIMSSQFSDKKRACITQALIITNL